MLQEKHYRSDEGLCRDHNGMMDTAINAALAAERERLDRVSEIYNYNTTKLREVTGCPDDHALVFHVQEQFQQLREQLATVVEALNRCVQAIGDLEGTEVEYPRAVALAAAASEGRAVLLEVHMEAQRAFDGEDAEEWQEQSERQGVE